VTGGATAYVFWIGTNGSQWQAHWNGSTWVGPYDRGMGTLG
jgi:hypothetical protein